jgi:hypothetical protein
MATTAAAFVADRIASMTKQNELMDKAPYFCWKLREFVGPQ